MMGGSYCSPDCNTSRRRIASAPPPNSLLLSRRAAQNMRASLGPSSPAPSAPAGTFDMMIFDQSHYFALTCTFFGKYSRHIENIAPRSMCLNGEFRSRHCHVFPEFSTFHSEFINITSIENPKISLQILILRFVISRGERRRRCTSELAHTRGHATLSIVSAPLRTIAATVVPARLSEFASSEKNVKFSAY